MQQFTDVVELISDRRTKYFSADMPVGGQNLFKDWIFTSIFRNISRTIIDTYRQPNQFTYMYVYRQISFKNNICH